MEPVENRARFAVKKTEHDLDMLFGDERVQNTKRATKSAVNIFRSYCIEREKLECFENFPAEELANTLRFSMLKVRKKGERITRSHP